MCSLQLACLSIKPLIDDLGRYESFNSSLQFTGIVLKKEEKEGKKEEKEKEEKEEKEKEEKDEKDEKEKNKKDEKKKMWLFLPRTQAREKQKE